MIAETIQWHVLADNPADLPDPDTTVLIETDPASEYSEPVFMGFHDGEIWRDVHTVPVPVIGWAEPPLGARQAAPHSAPRTPSSTTRRSCER